MKYNQSWKCSACNREGKVRIEGEISIESAIIESMNIHHKESEGKCEAKSSTFSLNGITPDQGEDLVDRQPEKGIRLFVTTKEGKIVLGFDRMLSWVGLEPAFAKELAYKMRDEADRLLQAKSRRIIIPGNGK